MNTTTILSLIVLLVSPAKQEHAGESEADARARYGMIAEAVAAEVKSDERLGLFLLTVGKHESTFARKVHDGRIRGDDGRSWGLFQIMCGRRMAAKVPGTKYRASEIVGVDKAATRRAVHAAAVHLRRHVSRCKGSPRCVFKSYGGVAKTAPKRSKVHKLIAARVATYRRLVLVRTLAKKKEPRTL